MSKKTQLRMIRVLLVILLGIGYVAVEAFYLGKHRMTVNYQKMSSKEIPEAFNEFSIAFFSDTHYLTYNNNAAMAMTIETIQKLQPDLIIFGGDLIDHPSHNRITEEERTDLVEQLKTLHAPYGKFAVYGNHDLESSVTKEEIKSILEEAGFHILYNTNVKIQKDDESYLRLIGIDSMLLGDPDIPKAYQDVLLNDYAITVCHTPDIATKLNTNLTDLALSGHSHGHQIYIPFVSEHFLPPYAVTYHRGRYQIQNTTLFVTNGIGTTASSIRLFANREVMLLRLFHEEEEPQQ